MTIDIPPAKFGLKLYTSKFEFIRYIDTPWELYKLRQKIVNEYILKPDDYFILKYTGLDIRINSVAMLINPVNNSVIENIAIAGDNICINPY